MSERAFLTAEWRDLLMLNYAVPPAILEPFVPRGTELDAYEGVTYVSLVAFRFLNTRVLGLPIPFHRNFEEVNLRFYVRRIVAGVVRRAVVFIREVVPRRAIAVIARAAYNEPYLALPTRSVVTGYPPRVCYVWRSGKQSYELRAESAGAGAVPASGSHEEFITNHLWGYTRQRDGSSVEYEVSHPPWHVWPAVNVMLSPSLGTFYGDPFDGMLDHPASAFIAGGSEVTVHRPTRLESL